MGDLYMQANTILCAKLRLCLPLGSGEYYSYKTMDFSLSTYYNAFDVEKQYDVDLSNVNDTLERVTNSLAHSPDAICQDEQLLEDLIDLLHSFLSLDLKQRKQVAYLISSSFNNACHNTKQLLDMGDFMDLIDILKAVLERFGYLIFVTLSFLGKEEFPGSGNLRLKQSSVKWKTNCTEVEDALAAITTCLQLDLSKIFVTTPEKNQFLEMFIRPIFHLMELPDRMKLISIKALMFRNIAFSVTRHSLASVVQNLIMQALTYYPHLPPYMAELLFTLNSQFDYPSLTEDLLREISQLEFNSNDSNGPKAVSEFLIKLSELSPRIILKQMSSTAQLLDNSNQSLRCSVVETCGNIVIDILKSEAQNPESIDEHMEHQNMQIDGLLNLLEERFLDQNPFVRTKSIQAITKICSSSARIPKRRQGFMLIAVRSLGDKSTLVRRNAIKLMCKLLLTHPFSATHGTQLTHSVWSERLKEAESELNKYMPVTSYTKKKEDGKDSDDENENSPSDSDIDHEELNESMMEQESRLPDKATLIKLKLTVQYYQDAIEFIEAIEEGTSVASSLLFSKNRNEVLEAMDFLVLSDAYGIENSHKGIRRMLHLVWMKGSSDEGKSISSHLIDCYKQLFLTAPPNASASQTAILFAKNLIGLTFSASVADLASLEKLLCLLYEAKLIHNEVINVLWHIYNKAGLQEPEYNEANVHGAIIILGMLSLSDALIVQRGLDSLLRIGLGDIGKHDLQLCKFSCSTLLKVIKLNTNTGSDFNANGDPVAYLRNILLLYTENTEWYEVAEQAITAIFKISPDPIKVCTDFLKVKAEQAFECDNEQQSQAIFLSQLFFIVGHIGIQTIEYLEKLETLFKKKKHEAERKPEDKNDEGENELEMIGGTSEDDFTDAVIYIKERELLFGDNSLLARFGPLVKEVCSNNHMYSDEMLQRSAVLCLGKLMCISSKFCEENLPLFITIMEKSSDPVIRSNCVLGLGDMAVCFNNLVDENTDFLYRRLTDDNIMVQRTCLMTVTFLILAGQVKVKGQLSSMAKCLEHPDQSISDMCRLFFSELATKDNAIYNGFIDIFSGLSSDAELSKDSMKRIIKFLVGFIDKEKHQKQLSEKLLVRLTKCQTESQWEDVAYVLSAIPYKNDSITQAIEGGYKMVQARD